mgnify:CR=1 FL=1
MIKYIEAIESLPVEIKLPLIKAFELFKEEIAETVKRSDLERFERATEENFKKVWQSIQELAEAQKRTEQRVEELAEEVKKLAISLNTNLVKGLIFIFHIRSLMYLGSQVGLHLQFYGIATGLNIDWEEANPYFLTITALFVLYFKAGSRRK